MALARVASEVAARFKPEDLRLVRQMRERKLRTKRGPLRLTREYLYFPDLAVGLFPPRPSAQPA